MKREYIKPMVRVHVPKLVTFLHSVTGTTPPVDSGGDLSTKYRSISDDYNYDSFTERGIWDDLQ